jgi:riboflavin kinase/FMN adenylyltransferase
LLDGNVQLAAAFLGAPFRLTGIVVEGDRRGRCLGFPTANLAWEQELLPAPGVYATSAHCPAHWEGRALGLTNVGTRPTFKGNCMTVETFFPNFAADLYGAKLALDFLHRIRGEEKLSGAAELSEKIAHDVDSAVAWWKSARKGRPLENEKGQAGKFSGLAGGS